jgi:predicted enzyme related to lactoylglutathione lyase
VTSSAERPAIGSIGWWDLTVPDAESVRDFYTAVVGWQSEPIDMGGYSDFVMKTPAGAAVAGVCHARGVNADLPPYWLPYVIVADLDASLQHCAEHGGSAVTEIKSGEDGSRYCVIQDPAGAVLTLMEMAG